MSSQPVADWAEVEPPPESEFERLPPQDNDAEQSVLGAMLLSKDAIGDAQEALSGPDFYRPAHETLYDAIVGLYARGEPADPVTVVAELSKQGNLVKVGGAPYVHTLTANVPITANAAYYAGIVREKAILRGLVDAGTRIAQMGYSGHGDVDHLTGRAQQAVDNVVRSRNASQARTLAALLPEAIDVAQNGQQNNLGTGWPDLDHYLGGLAPGRLVVFGARPGVGKSIVAANLAVHFASHHQHAVLVSSLEMPHIEVTHRMLAAYAGVNLTRLQKCDVDESSWSRISRVYGELGALPITVDDSPSQTVGTIRRAAHDVQREREDLAIIVVDYLQLVSPTDNRVNRVEQLSEISRGLKLLARETGTCVVAAAQLNRGPAQRHDKRPVMSDLRESGSIENDADQVVLIHQPDEEIPEVELIVDKNRHGPKGVARLQVQGHYARLVSIEWSPTRGATA